MCCIKMVLAACCSCDVIIYGLKAPRAEQLSDASWQITCDHNAASQRSSCAAAAHNWVQSICVINSRRCPPQKSIDIASRRHKNAPLFVWALWLAIPIPLLTVNLWHSFINSQWRNTAAAVPHNLNINIAIWCSPSSHFGPLFFPGLVIKTLCHTAVPEA